MSAFLRTKIGLERAWRSPGPLRNWEAPIGFWRRAKTAGLKLKNLTAAPFSPNRFAAELRQWQLVCPTRLNEDQRYTTSEFFRAFSNQKARDATRRAKTYAYTRSISQHHPRKDTLNYALIIDRCHELMETIFSRLAVLQEYPDFLYPIIASMSRGAEKRESIWSPEYHEAYEQYKKQDKLPQRNTMLAPFMVGNSLVDIGCGGGDQVAYYREHHPEIRRAAGIDVVDWRTPGLNIDYHVVDFAKAGANAPAQYDTGWLLAVLHHVARLDQVEKVDVFLQGVRTAVRRRLIVEEDVIVPSRDLVLGTGKISYLSASNPFLETTSEGGIGGYYRAERAQVEARIQQTDKLIPGMEEFFALADQPLLEEYLGLDEQTQRDFTILNDYLANALSVGVPHMPFPFGFRTIPEWIEIFSRNGFDLNRIKVYGFQTGNFNQVCHVHFILDVVN